MPVHTGRLLLTTQDPFLAPDPEPLRTGLASAGLLGGPLAGIGGAYQAGERFLELVVFTGCSVQISFVPPVVGDNPFCYVRFAGPYAAPRLLSGRNTRPPRCRACRAPLRDWRTRLETSGSGDVRCPACGVAAPPWGWDWKEQAGWGRVFVGIEEVFPGEATPTPALMALLAEVSGGAAWRHFYVQDP